MSQTAPEIATGPLVFDLSDEEARIGAARAGFRAALRRRFSLRHVAPLVAFTLLIAFAAILALTGLIARRLAEAAIILAAIAFMASRLAAHWRLRRAQSAAPGVVAGRMNGPTRIVADASGLTVHTASGARRYDYRACREAETTGTLIYLWSDSDAPAIIPARIFSSRQAADQFVAVLRAAIARARGGSDPG
jgi:hypothetical protein